MKTFNIILASCENGGIGFDNTLPWDIPQDMAFFKKVTSYSPLKNLQNIVIMGRKTFDSLGGKPLPNRLNIIVTSQEITRPSDNKVFVNNFNDAINITQLINHNQTWVIGGRSIYLQALNHDLLDKIYWTKIKDYYDCDTFIKMPKVEILSSDELDKLDFQICKLVSNESKYLHLLSKTLNTGNERETRNATTLSLFNEQIELDLSDGKFPLLTSKKMFWKGIVEELLFFIRGETNTKLLEKKNVKIWKGNTNQEFLDKMGFDYDEGEMGPLYGYQWRNFNKPFQQDSSEYIKIDQLQNLIELIKSDPHSRRLLMTDYNPAQVHLGVLYPCHSLILQFYIEDDKISVKMYQRSADLFLGVPFNIASTSLLLCIIAKLTNLKPNKVSLTFGDVHIYKSHTDSVLKQLKNPTFQQPKLELPNFNTIEEVEMSNWKDFKIIDYQSNEKIFAEMIA